MTEIYIDIETIPTQVDAMRQYLVDGVKAPANYKDPEKIAAYIEEQKEDVVNKAAFDGASNHIICIGVAIDDQPSVSFSIDGDVSKEAMMLDAFYSYLKDTVGNWQHCTWIGHNVINFDLKILRQRSMILGVKPPANIIIPANSKPWESNPYDTMMQWDAKNFIKLDKLALALNIPMGKSMSGADVYPLWQQGEYDAIADYCRGDVDLVRLVYERMTA